MNYKPNKSRMRATFAAGGTNEPRLANVDREAEVLHDVQITLEGEARGHGIWLDRQFCEDVTKQGNEMGEAGVKVRFGHPAMCSDAIGTYLGRAKNFRTIELTRKDGTQASGVIADIHLAAEAHNSPKGDLSKWVMDTAENSPDTFGQSIVFTYSDFKVKDEDGNDHLLSDYIKEDGEGRKAWEKKSCDGKTYAVLGKLHGTDFTDTPAATDGVFSADDIASKAEAMLDENPDVLEAIEKNPDAVVQFLTRVGIIDSVADERVKGYQRKATETYNSLKAKYDESVEMLAQRDKYIAECDAQFAEKMKELDTLKEEFENAKASLVSLEEEKTNLLKQNEEAIAKLAHAGDQLAKAQTRLATIGHEVNRIPDEEAWDYNEELSKATSLAERKEVAYKAAKFKKGK